MIRDHLGDPGVDGRLILRWIFRKWEVAVWTVSRGLRTGKCGGHLLMRQWTFRFYKMRGISWLTENRLVSQEVLCSMEWVWRLSNIFMKFEEGNVLEVSNPNKNSTATFARRLNSCVYLMYSWEAGVCLTIATRAFFFLRDRRRKTQINVFSYSIFFVAQLPCLGLGRSLLGFWDHTQTHYTR
jgi:hypothetical protein